MYMHECLQVRMCSTANGDLQQQVTVWLLVMGFQCVPQPHNIMTRPDPWQSQWCCGMQQDDITDRCFYFGFCL